MLIDPPGRQGPGPRNGDVVKGLELAPRKRVRGLRPGERRAAGRGSGTELAQLRPYEVGDDPRMLDAAASARTGIPHVRQHVPERALTTWIVLDLSASMAFGTGTRLKSDVAEGAAAAVSEAAMRHGGRAALLTAGAPVTHALPPRSGRRALAALQRLVGAGVAPDEQPAELTLAAALERVQRLSGSGGLVTIISDFRDQGWENPLRALGQRHALTAIEITDPREAQLPDIGEIVLLDPETGQLVDADTTSARVRHAFAAAEAMRREHVAAAVRRARADHVVLSTDADWLRTLASALR